MLFRSGSNAFYNLCPGPLFRHPDSLLTSQAEQHPGDTNLRCAWLAWSVERTTLDLEVVGLSPMWGVEGTWQMKSFFKKPENLTSKHII